MHRRLTAATSLASLASFASLGSPGARTSRAAPAARPPRAVATAGFGLRAGGAAATRTLWQRWFLEYGKAHPGAAFSFETAPAFPGLLVRTVDARLAGGGSAER